MDFFEDLGNKIEQTKQAVIAKTRKTTDSVKLKNLIAEEKKGMKENLMHIGEIYLSRCGENPEPEYKQFVEAIQQAKKNISTYSEQIKQLKGIIQCPNCGADISYGSMYCSSCGEKIPSVTPASNPASFILHCSKCGASIPNGKNFCSRCGAKVEAKPQESQPTQSSPINGIKCQKCGALIPADKKFCTECGARVETTTVNQQPKVQQQTEEKPKVEIHNNTNSNPKTVGKKCPECGKNLPDDAVFCTECGLILKGGN